MSITFMPQQFWGGFTGIEPGLTGLAEGVGNWFNPGYKESRERVRWINTPISEGGLGGWQNAFNNERQKEWMSQFVRAFLNNNYIPTTTPGNPYIPPYPENSTDIGQLFGGNNIPAQPVIPLLPDTSFINQFLNPMYMFPPIPPAMPQIHLPKYKEGGAIKVNTPIKVLQDLMGLEKNEVPVVAHKGEAILNKEATNILGNKNIDTLNKIGQLMPKAESGGRITIGNINTNPNYLQSKENLGRFSQRIGGTLKHLAQKIREAIQRAQKKGTNINDEISPELKELYAKALKDYSLIHQGQHLIRESDIMNQVNTGKNVTGIFSSPTAGRNIIPDILPSNETITQYNYPDALTRYLLTRGGQITPPIPEPTPKPTPVKKTQKNNKKESVTPTPPSPTPTPQPIAKEYQYPTPSGTPTNWQNGLPSNYNDMTQALWNMASNYPSERGPMFALSGQYIGQPQQDQRMQIFNQLMSNYTQAKQIPAIEASTEYTKQSAIAKGIANNWDRIAEPLKIKQLQIQTKQLEAVDPHIKELMDLEIKGKKLGLQKEGQEIIAAKYRAAEALMRAYALSNGPTIDVKMYQDSVNDYIKNINDEMSRIKDLANKNKWTPQIKRAYYRLLLQRMVVTDPNLVNKSPEELRQIIGAETKNFFGKTKGEGGQILPLSDIQSLLTEVTSSPAFIMSKKIGETVTGKSSANVSSTSTLLQILNQLGILK